MAAKAGVEGIPQGIPVLVMAARAAKEKMAVGLVAKAATQRTAGVVMVVAGEMQPVTLEAAMEARVATRKQQEGAMADVVEIPKAGDVVPMAGRVEMDIVPGVAVGAGLGIMVAMAIMGEEAPRSGLHMQCSPSGLSIS